MKAKNFVPLWEDCEITPEMMSVVQASAGTTGEPSV
jgi:hypothetical protein